MCGVNKAGEPLVYKRALAAGDFLQLGKFDDVLTHATHLLIGHNRYATMGNKNDDNAHPFQHGDITLAHNGTLTTKVGVNTKDKLVFDTDSETITRALSNDNYINVLERLEGAYALTWYDKADNTINFARNDERELYVGHLGNDLVWASEKAMLELAASHHKRQLRDVELLPVGEHRMYELGKIQEGFIKTKFVPKKRIVTAKTYRGGNTSGMNTRNQTPIVGTTIKAWLESVRDSGYVEGFTAAGQRVIANIPKDNVAVWRGACQQDRQFTGTVVSTRRVWASGVLEETLSMSGKGLKIVALNLLENTNKEAAPEKKCCLCDREISTDDEAEQHMGEHYHTACLDYMDNNYSSEK